MNLVEQGRLRLKRVKAFQTTNEDQTSSSASLSFMDAENTLFIAGERGAGKTYLARQLAKDCGDFVEFNCSSVPQKQLNYVLFGLDFHAVDREFTPIVIRANNRVLFLDEIDCLGLEQQKILLSVMREHKVLSLSNGKALTTSFQLISTSNQNLEELVERGQFRKDLFDHLTANTLNVPSFKERKDIVASLIEKTLESYNQSNQGQISFVSEDRETFTSFICSHDSYLPNGLNDIRLSVIRMASSARTNINNSHVNNEISRFDAKNEPVVAENASYHPASLREEQSLFSKLGLNLSDFSLLEVSEVNAIYKACFASKNMTDAGTRLISSAKSMKKAPNCYAKMDSLLKKYGLLYENLRNLQL